MKHISILVLKGASMTNVDGTHQLFSRMNDFLKYRGQEPYYRIDLVAVDEYTVLNNDLYTIRANKIISEIKNTDLIIIPILCGDFEKMITANKGFEEWIKERYQNGSEIASLSVGCFYLASTGLLNGKKCATHWASKNDFQNMFPDVNIVDDIIITEENGIYTGGGPSSYLNLLLYIIEKHLGKEIAVLASKMFEIEIDRKDQKQFAIFMGQKKHGDTEVLSAQEFIENNPDKKFMVDDVCFKFGIGRRTFERRFKKSTGNSFAEYIQRVKVESAKKQLETGRKTVNEIIFEVGYNDINAFRQVFKKYTGMLPVDYRKKYRR